MKHLPLKFQVAICIERDGPEYHAYCPTLKGLHVPGDTKEEALKKALDAAKAYLASLIKHNDPIPLSCIVEPRKECKKPSNKNHSRTLQLIELTI